MTIAIINPGTGYIRGARLQRARANIRAFRRALLPTIEHDIVRRPELDDREGRYGYMLVPRGRPHRLINILMPGVPRADLDFRPGWWPPRLYVDDSSWQWDYALDAARRLNAGLE